MQHDKYCLKGEVWKDIPNYEGLYQASNMGRIRTVDGKRTYTKRHGDRIWQGRIMKPKGINEKTGHRVALWKDGECKDYLVARLVGFTFLGIPKEVITINHKDGNRFNNNIKNLEWLTIGDNVRHAFDTGLMPYKRVIIKTLTGELEEFRSMAEASKAIGRNHGYISLCKDKEKPITDKFGNEVKVFIEI